MGLVASNIFREAEKPKYQTASFGAVGALAAGTLGAYMVWDNGRSNRRQGVVRTARDVPTKWLRDGPRSEEFKWFL